MGGDINREERSGRRRKTRKRDSLNFTPSFVHFSLMTFSHLVPLVLYYSIGEEGVGKKERKKGVHRPWFTSTNKPPRLFRDRSRRVERPERRGRGKGGRKKKGKKEKY